MGSALTGPDNFAVYSTGYYYDGTAWQELTYEAGPDAERAGPWILGDATAAAPLDYLESANTFFAAYTCHWRGSADGWQCGCQDASCDTPAWQLQAVPDPTLPDDPAAGPGSGSGSSDGGSYTPSGDWSLEDALELHGTPELDTFLWVDPAGSDSAPGTEAAPLETINEALDRAAPGTAIMIRAGIYRETLRVPKSGKTDAPILLVSADDRGTATIIGTDLQEATITILSKRHIGIHGLRVVSRTLSTAERLVSAFEYSRAEAEDMLAERGSGYTGGGDLGPIKLIRGGDHVIAGNIIDGTAAADGIKIATGDRMTIVGNSFLGVWPENHIDAVGTDYIEVRYNEFFGTSRIGPIQVKAGSWYVDFTNNLIDVTYEYPRRNRNNQTGVAWGGISEGASRAVSEGRSQVLNGDARYVTMRENVILGDISLRVVSLRGARDVLIERNFLCGGEGTGQIFWSGRSRVDNDDLPGGRVRLYPADNTAVDNIYCAGANPDGTIGDRETIRGNREGTLSDVTWPYGPAG